MRQYNTVEGLGKALEEVRKAGKTIGFVPTMGALHQGHMSLVDRAVAACDVVVVSIFVNPTQFNDPEDLRRYPRTLEEDLALLRTHGASFAFTPSVEEIYPEQDRRTFDVGTVAEVMEGKHRPGHFRGVMQVVSRLFDIVKPAKAFFGEKDFQQVAVIRAMVKLLGQEVTIVACPIHRDTDGLAMSSRNSLLSQEERAVAPEIYRVLRASREMTSTLSPSALIRWVTEEINKEPLLQVEYFELVDSDSLEAVEHWDDAPHIQGCITVFCGKIRLIDNVAYK